jgi:ABC-2 type transport system permease protein
MNKTGIIIKREFNERVRKKSFLVTTILTPLLFVAMIGGMIAMMTIRTSETKVIEVIDNSGVVAPHLESSEAIKYVATDRTLDDIKADPGDAWGVLVIDSAVMSNSSAQLVTFSTSTFDTEMAIAGDISDIVETEKLKTYDIQNLSQILDDVRTNITLRAYKVDDSGTETESSSIVAWVVAYILGFLMYMFVLLYGAQVMTGVIEEKNSRVLEVVVSSVRPFQLMMGKILGIALVAVTQLAIWVVVIAVLGSALIHFAVPSDILTAAQEMSQGMPEGMAQSGMDSAMVGAMENPEMVAALSNIMDVGYLGKMFVVFLFYFVVGYLLYAALFAAVGSAVDNVQDSQQFQMPITLPLIVGLIGMLNAMQDPTGTLAVWLSLIPFTSPLVMVARIPFGVPAWELALSIGLLIGTFVVLVWLAGKIYRVGIFMYGKKPSFKEIAKWITYK